MHPLVTRLLIRALLWLGVILLAGAAVMTAVVPAQAATVGSWNEPGVNPFKGSRWHAVMSYKSMPLIHRIILGMRVQWDEPDMIISISKHTLRATGQQFTTDIVGMHFGKWKRFESVDRSGWSDDHIEHAAAWCHEESCIGSPYVCGNIFAVWRKFDADTVRKDATEEARTFRDEVAHVSEPSNLILHLFTFAACVWITRRAVMQEKDRR